MAAALIPAPAGDTGVHRLRLPPPGSSASAVEEVRFGLGSTLLRGGVQLESGSWALDCDDLRQIGALLQERGLSLRWLLGGCPTTLVAAAALGLEVRATELPEQRAGELVGPPSELPGAAGAAEALLIHQGTLRSGDHLQTEGSVLVLGDVNPGARLSAGGHVLVWGRLRGVAHAGREGEGGARIVALQLRPLQLRIADAVARGPEESPPEGMAEEARLVNGEIRIEPASPLWPLS